MKLSVGLCSQIGCGAIIGKHLFGKVWNGTIGQVKVPNLDALGQSDQVRALDLAEEI